MKDDLYVADVARTRRLSPAMRRITLASEALHAFPTTGVGDEFVRVLFPDHAGILPLPNITADATTRLPNGAAPHIQCYTVRHHNADAGEIDIDFVLHAHGRATQWARAARPGDRLACDAPHAIYAPPAAARRHVFVTDATGIPGLSRILEQLPTHIDATAVIEIAEPSHRIDLARPTGALDLRWITGRGNGVAPSAITEALHTLPIDGADNVYVWVAGEAGELRNARHYLRHELGLPGHRYRIASYWRHQAEQWQRRYDALDHHTRATLAASWQGIDDEELATDRYEHQLKQLGL